LIWLFEQKTTQGLAQIMPLHQTFFFALSQHLSPLSYRNTTPSLPKSYDFAVQKECFYRAIALLLWCKNYAFHSPLPLSL
jgi:hypothetical protein